MLGAAPPIDGNGMGTPETSADVALELLTVAEAPASFGNYGASLQGSGEAIRGKLDAYLGGLAQERPEAAEND